MWDVNDRRHVLTNIVTITGLPLNDRGSPSPLWKYWWGMAKTLNIGQHGYMVQESFTYTRRRVGLETKYHINLPDEVGIRYGSPSFSARDHVDYVAKTIETYPGAKSGAFNINPTTSFNFVALKNDEQIYVLPLFDRTLMLPKEDEFRPYYPSIPKEGATPPMGPSIGSVLISNVLDSLYNRKRAAAFSGLTPVTVISDGTVEDYDYEFDLN